MQLRCVTGAILLIATTLGALPIAGQQQETKTSDALRVGIDTIKGSKILDHVKKLASDEFEGRAPGTRGEDLTVNYLIEQFAKTGAKPGNPNGTFIQNVPLVGYRTTPKISISANGNAVPFEYLGDFVHDYPELIPRVEVENAEVVFAGYGITAPQFRWDDYKDVDVKGKLVLVLSGEPSRLVNGDEKNLDPTFFKGVVRTNYSTRESKYEQAQKRGAAGLLVIYDPEKANTYSLFRSSATLEGQNLKPKPGAKQLAIAGLMTTNAAGRIFSAASLDLVAEEKKAQLNAFRAKPLKVTASISLQSILREIRSRNVVAKIVGSDPQLRNEYVIYTAHWDHLGVDPSLKGDQIYNGANDNAIGVAQLIEAARAFANLKQKPARSVLFIATTAEEKGYLGARYYLQNPLYPIAASVANINLDAGNLFGLTSDLASTGYGNSDLDSVLETAATMQGRKFVTGSLDTTGGMYFASDQIEFANAGIPAVFPWSGFEYVGKPKDFGDNAWSKYSDERYHKVTDEVMPDWDATGAVEDTRWFVIAGFLVANGAARPKWLESSEFGWKPSR